MITNPANPVIMSKFFLAFMCYVFKKHVLSVIPNRSN